MSKNNKSGLGKAIQNKIERKHRSNMGTKAPIFYQQSQQNDSEIKKQKMKSVIQQNSLNQFLQIAEMSQQNFKANRDIKFREIREEIRQKKIIIIDNKQVIVQDQIDQKKLKGLQMPKRPNWKQTSSKQQLEHKQSEAYLNWRRNLAHLQQSNADIKITPYEKNIQVWKQLWRVTERADLMIQIVDGRDPLFFNSQDLTDYVKELNPNKKSLLLINKSDLVPEQIRLRWNKYFIQNKIPHIFFSAKIASNIIDTEQISETTKQHDSESQHQNVQTYFNKPQILTIEELTQIMQLQCAAIGKQKIEVGLVGYPNVGKSSVINALFGKKKVGVASMPGKTKHFQTLKLTQKVTLCDCPGLVFPRISSSHAYMVLNGLYPIDTIKSYTEPINILIQRIQQSKIEKVYSLFWKESQVYDHQTLLNKLAQLKGVFTGSGQPNKSFASKILLKDYVNGVLVYARNPPGLIGEQLKQQQRPNMMKKPKQIDIKIQKTAKNLQNEIDSQFFKNEIPQKISLQDTIKTLTEDDLLDIIQGRKISGIRITKQIRKNIKHAMKRGETLEQIKKKYFQYKQMTPHKNLVKIQ